MSSGAPLDVSDYAFAVLVSDYHGEITSRLLEGAKRALADGKALDTEVFHVPGAFELPVAAKLLAETDDYDAIVCIGCVIRGETTHFELISNEAARGIQQASLMTGVPMSFGVVTTDNAQQAEARAGSGNDNKGWEAARTAMQMALFVGSLPDSDVSGQMILIDESEQYDDDDNDEEDL